MKYSDLEAIGITIERGSLASGFASDNPRTIDPMLVKFCIHGHAKTVANVYVSNGKETCKTCHAIRNAKASAIRREQRRIKNGIQ